MRMYKTVNVGQAAGKGADCNMRGDKRIKLCFVADDYGESKATNEAIERVCRGNIVRSLTVVSSENSVYSDILYEKEKNIAVGIHLFLSVYRPLTAQIGELANNGEAIRKSKIALALFSGKLTPRHIYEEFDAQILRLREFGIVPEFIDTHQNIHGLPIVLQIVRQIASKYGLHNRIRPFAQLDFNLKTNWRSMLFGLHSAAAGFRRDSKVLVNCPGYKKKTIEVSRALGDWDRFITGIKKKGLREVFVPCHPGISPAEIELYSSPELLKLIDKRQISLSLRI